MASGADLLDPRLAGYLEAPPPPADWRFLVSGAVLVVIAAITVWRARRLLQHSTPTATAASPSERLLEALDAWVTAMNSPRSRARLPEGDCSQWPDAVRRLAAATLETDLGLKPGTHTPEELAAACRRTWPDAPGRWEPLVTLVAACDGLRFSPPARAGNPESLLATVRRAAAALREAWPRDQAPRGPAEAPP